MLSRCGGPTTREEASRRALWVSAAVSEWAGRCCGLAGILLLSCCSRVEEGKVEEAKSLCCLKASRLSQRQADRHCSAGGLIVC